MSNLVCKPSVVCPGFEWRFGYISVWPKRAGRETDPGKDRSHICGQLNSSFCHVGSKCTRDAGKLHTCIAHPRGMDASYVREETVVNDHGGDRGYRTVARVLEKALRVVTSSGSRETSRCRPLVVSLALKDEARPNRPTADNGISTRRLNRPPGRLTGTSQRRKECEADDLVESSHGLGPAPGIAGARKPDSAVFAWDSADPRSNIIPSQSAYCKRIL